MGYYGFLKAHDYSNVINQKIKYYLGLDGNLHIVISDLVNE